MVEIRRQQIQRKIKDNTFKHLATSDSNKRKFVIETIYTVVGDSLYHRPSLRASVLYFPSIDLVC